MSGHETLRDEASRAVAVLIAAFNSERTIATAIKSALAQAETAEVIVIDDCSSDKTVEIAREAGRDNPRFKLIEQSFNQGPSAARNRGIDASTAPFLAVLDADDAFIPGRFRNLPSSDTWDLCADNIRFTRDRGFMQEIAGESDPSSRSCTISFKTFVNGNIGQRGERRTELGFLKPVIRRDFLDRHGLRFDETCRLGEDFILYAQMLAKGARFTLIEACGYAALERDNSLSADHSVTHLRALLRASRDLAAKNGLSKEANEALRIHARLVSEKIAHREVLEKRRHDGLMSALFAMASRPTTLRDILLDRVNKPPAPKPGARRLISPEAFDRLMG